MPGYAVAEIYFIAAMMVLILVISGVAVYFFARTYKKEMREKRERIVAREQDKRENDAQPAGVDS
ncbi:MAG: hypothetical protein H7070_07490 [Saprospiraceae bacterium]|nr:hypothetical protein [Pyrinomonadaceae bacterium]